VSDANEREGKESNGTALKRATFKEFSKGAWLREVEWK
jgi:hypothetical protein